MRKAITYITLSFCLLFGVATVIHEAPPPASRFVERHFKTPLTHHITLKEEACLVQALYYEAGNQSPKGKEAVAVVILNRVGQRGYPKTICGVVRQAHIVKDRKICQFSFWCFEKRKPSKEGWEESKIIARRVLQNSWERDILFQFNDAMYFHADYVRPYWKKHKVFVGKIGNHLFYKEKDNG